MAFLKTGTPKQFNYIPRFYDERKADLKQRIKAINNQVNASESDEYTPNFKGQFKKRHEAIWGKPVAKKGRSISRWMMLIIYACLVVAIIYLILNLLSHLQ